MQTTDTTPIGRRLDGYMQVQVNRNHFTGTVLIAQNGKFLLAKGYGYANAEWETPNTLQAKFRLGSLTKQFTATAIMQLRDKGLLTLQDSICNYLRPCISAWQPVTLHHLLSHTSGIAGYGGGINPSSSPLVLAGSTAIGAIAYWDWLSRA
jgi:CubicO group peptidase (beta-lactamase class C family)